MLFKFPTGVAEIILGYTIEWTMIPIVESKILDDMTLWHHWRRLSLNPHGVDYLDLHPELIDWTLIAANPAASHLIFSEQTKKRFTSGYHPGAGRGNRPVWLNGQKYYVNIAMLCRNSSETAIEVLRALPLESLVWDQLSNNIHPWAISMLLAQPHKIRPDAFQANPSAAPYLEQLGWLMHFNTMVSSNPNKELSARLRANPAMIHPKGMLRNPELVNIFLDDCGPTSEYAIHRPRWAYEMGTTFDIARNPNPRAIAFHVTHKVNQTIDQWNDACLVIWESLIANPGIFELTEPSRLRNILL